MRKVLLAGAAVLALTGTVQAQCGDYSYTSISNGNVYYSCDSNSHCRSSSPDEDTLAAWAADHAVSAQLASWPDEKAIGKLDRAGLDALATALCKWAQKLSNHIVRDSYARWAQNEQSYVESRRSTLDKLDVAKGLVTGLPTLPGDLK